MSNSEAPYSQPQFAQEVQARRLSSPKGLDLNPPILLCLHGGPGMDHSYFLPSLEPLSDSAELIFYTHAQHGQLEMRGLVDELHALILRIRAASPSRPLYLLGHSFGGAHALEYVKAHGTSALAGLILVSWVYDHRYFQFAKAKNSAIFENIAETIRRRNERHPESVSSDADASYLQTSLDYVPVYFVPSHHEAGRGLFRQMRFNGKLFHKMGSEYMGTLDLTDVLRSGLRDLPVISICGTEDGIVPVEYIREGLRQSPGIRFHEIGGAGHFPFVEAAEPFNSIVRQFLKEEK